MFCQMPRQCKGFGTQRTLYPVREQSAALKVDDETANAVSRRRPHHDSPGVVIFATLSGNFHLGIGT